MTKLLGVKSLRLLFF